MMTLAVYDCGSEAESRGRFDNRDCTEVAGVFGRCESGEGMWTEVGLEGVRGYFLVVEGVGRGGRGGGKVVVGHEVVDGVSGGEVEPGMGKVPLPWPLKAGRTQTFSGKGLGGSETYFEGGGEFQLVFEVFGGNGMDVIGSCVRKTSVRARFIVLWCGDGSEGWRNYGRRKCEEVGRSGVGDLCGKFRTKMEIGLGEGKRYFVVVDVFVRAGVGPVLGMFHRVLR